MKNIKNILISFSAASALTVCALTGCALSEESGYTREDLDNLAKLEVYEAGSDTLLKTIEDEETLYRYNQLFSMTMTGDEDDFAEWETERESCYEQGEGELEEKPEEEETHLIAVYKYPVAKFGDKEPVKMLTMTLYENTDIVKITVSDDSIKMFSLPEDFLTFYYRMSEEEREFYASLTE